MFFVRPLAIHALDPPKNVNDRSLDTPNSHWWGQSPPTASLPSIYELLSHEALIPTQAQIGGGEIGGGAQCHERSKVINQSILNFIDSTSVL